MPFAGLFAAAALAAASPAHAQAMRLADSTLAESWTLACGLKVVTRHVPRAGAVAITVCYPAGTDRDQEGREGLSALLAEVAFTAPAGTAPERRREEMDEIRPMGWVVKVTRRFTQLTENASHATFPGVLHQVCERMRGVTVTQSVLDAATAQVRRELATNYNDRPDRALYYLAGELSGGASFEAALRRGSGAGLQRLAARDVQRFLGDRFSPSAAVLSIAGNLQGYDVRRMLEYELGSLAAGDPAPPVSWGTLSSAQASIGRNDLPEPRGVIGVLSPNLDDPRHPGFYRFAVIFGSFCASRWGPPDPPLTTRFQYSLTDDPELARYYPPIVVGQTRTLEEELRLTLADFMLAAPDSQTQTKLAGGVAWLVGGPLPRDLVLRMRQDPATLTALGSNLAARALYGDDEFWSTYRRRFESDPLDFGAVSQWFTDPEHHVQLLFTPER
jgi:hypothetical protein